MPKQKSISNTIDKELEKEKEKHMLAFYMLESNEKKRKILLHVPLKSLILAIEGNYKSKILSSAPRKGLFLHLKAINVEILWVKVSNLTLGIYIYIYILWCCLENNFFLISKLDSYAFLFFLFLYSYYLNVFILSHDGDNNMGTVKH